MLLLSSTIYGQISVNGSQIKNLASPTDPADAVNFEYILQLENQIEQMDLNIDNDCDGFTENEGDCNDNDKSISPENLEIIDDGIDNDCDGLIDEYVFNEIDDDGDGYNEINGDCDDSNINVYPGNDEIQDGLDNNCNGEIDEIAGNEINSIINILNDIEDKKAYLVTVNQLKNNYFISGETYEFTSDIVLKGYVVSNDSSGNFFKEIYIQDDSISPTGGIRILIDETDLYKKYNFGREIYINLRGLHIGEYRFGAGVVSIGELDDNQNRLSYIRSLKSLDHIFRSDITINIEPLNLIFSEINHAHIGTYVSISNANVVTSQIGKPFVDKYDSFDTQRTLEACEGIGKSSFILETSANASFRDIPLPSGTGNIRGIVSKTYYGDSLVLMLNSIDDVDMSGEECSLFASVFEDDFSSGDFTNWTTYNVTGSQQWEVVSFGNPAPSMQMNGYSAGSKLNEDWLISKAIDLSANTGNVYFVFDSVKRYSGDDIEVFYATDYTGGNPNSDGTWTKLSPTLDTNDGSWSSWTSSGAQTLDNAAGGNLFVAFKYTSTTSNANTFQIDNVKIYVE